jgi:hypothetical protein
MRYLKAALVRQRSAQECRLRSMTDAPFDPQIDFDRLDNDGYDHASLDDVLNALRNISAGVVVVCVLLGAILWRVW